MCELYNLNLKSCNNIRNNTLYLRKVKKILSILIAFLILLSLMQFTIATHYCGGDGETFVKFSITGELASCGMESCDDKYSAQEKYFEKTCCNDNISVLAVYNNFAPLFTNFTVFALHVLKIYIIPVNIEIHSLIAIVNSSSADVSPPGNFLVRAVSLPIICVFLI